MNKEWFNIKTDNIEVPEDELFLAIDKGIEKGRKRKKYKKKTKILLSLTSIAASLLLVSGFVFSPMTKVMASVPIIGSFYESLNMKMGEQLEEINLITELNETASDKGINITLTSVYYDGIYIGITFKADGFELLDDEDVDGAYDFYLYEEEGVKVGWGGALRDLEKVDNYYVTAIEIEYPDKHLPKDFTLPIIFEKMGGIEGKWEFEVPVTQLPLKKYEIENRFTQNEKYSFNLESMIIGETNIRMDYTTTIPEDWLNFRILDDKGNELAAYTIQSHSIEYATFRGASVGDSKYLLIYPAYYEKVKGKWNLIKLEPIKVNMEDN